MASIVIINNDRDFSEVVSELVRRELGMDCHVADDEKQVGKWPDALVITGQKPPIRMCDLLAQLRARLAKAPATEWLAVGKWRLSPRLKQLSYNGKSASLTDKELQLLQYLREAEGSVSKEELLKKVWGFEPNVDTHTLETHVYRLRNKCRELHDEDIVIATENGYRINFFK